MHSTWAILGWLLLAPLSHPILPSPAEASLSDSVTIRRDTYGIPHILAQTEEAAAFGFGYAQAEDHALQIARILVSARGEQAKHFGDGADSDFLIRLYDVEREARRDLARVGGVYRKIVNAYAAGVNRYVEKHRGELPPWIPSFTGVDVMAARRAGAVRAAFSRGTRRALQRKYGSPDDGNAEDSLPAEMEDAPHPAPRWIPIEAPGSNAFALSGARTISGKPILLGNPHLSWSSLYWEAQVTVPGKINFFGSTLVGIPVLRAGFNERLGWVTTNNAPDVSDVFALPLDPRRPDHYIHNGKSRPLAMREIAVEVKTGEGATRTETRAFWESHLGKILYRNADVAFAVDSTQIDAFRYHEGFYELSKTRNLGEWRKVMSRNLVPTSNFTYADADGNIFYQWNARIPRRLDDGTDYRLDVPAGTDRYSWKGLIKIDGLPRLLNPSGGYIQNCNNPPWYTSLADPIDPAEYPSYLEADRDLALRPQMALEMLEGNGRHSLEDVVKMKYNTKMLLADRVKPDLVKAIESLHARSEDLRRGLDVIRAWDHRVSAGSRGGVLFQRFWDTYAAALSEPFAVAWNATKPLATPSGLADPRLAVEHFEAAVRWTRETFGSEEVAWGEVHRFRFGDLDLPADGASGSYGLFRVMSFAASPDGKRMAGRVEKDEPPVGSGDAWVIAVEFTRPIRARSVLAYGQSSHLSSPHSTDQIRLFADHQLRPIWFTEEEIRAHLEREYHP